MKKEAESVTAASMAKVKEAGAGTESMQKEMQKLKETHAAELKQQQEQSQKQYDNAKEEMSAAHSAALAAQAERLKQETVAEVERCLLEAENEAQRRLEAQADKLKAEASKRASVFQGKTQQYMAIIKQLRASNQVKQQKDAAKHQEEIEQLKAKIQQLETVAAAHAQQQPQSLTAATPPVNKWKKQVGKFLFDANSSTEATDSN